MTALVEMKQNDLLSWIQSIPEDGSFSSKIKQEIMNGIVAYAKREGSAITGLDFFEAEDADDVNEICGVGNRKSKLLLRKISEKKQQDFKNKKKKKGAVPTGTAPSEIPSSSQVLEFTLNITAMRGRMFTIKKVSKLTTVAQVKAKFLAELGDTAAANEYQGMISKWNKKGGKIEMKKGGRNMNDQKTLGFYGIVNGMHLPLVVAFKVSGGALDDSKSDEKDMDDEDQYRNRKLRRKKHKGVIKFTSKHDCIMDYTDEDGIPRAEMPCGCAFAADTMYRYVKSIFEKDFKETTAICPMPKNQCKGTDKQRHWPWSLVFIIADLSQKEVIRYTKAIEMRISGSKDCPHCGAITERPGDLRISRVRCDICAKSDWCWNCQKVWNHGGLGPICGNKDCMGQQLNDMLKMVNCGKVAAPWADITNTGKDIPQSRACPKCYTVLEYTEACKHIWCICCPHEFCFNCLRDWKSGDCSHSKSCDFTPVQEFK